MVSMKLYEYMGYELIEKVKDRDIKIQDILESCYKRIDEVESQLHSFVNLNKEKSSKKAKKYDENLKREKK